jgi:hypothetical protein
MQPVLLPSTSYYVSVDRRVLQEAMARIEEQFRDLLENGAQAQGIPAAVFAAGQHLNPYSMNQRGLYGTAAALLALARSRPSSQRIGFIEGLIKYVNERPAIETTLASTNEDVAMLNARFAIEWRQSFKCSELLYALAAAPPAVAGREALLRQLLDRLESGRRASGGWSADLDPGHDHDPLATASIVRALHTAGVPVTPTDLNIVRTDADTTAVNPYVRSFCVLVLLEINGAEQPLINLWNGLLNNLRPQLRERTEANYEYTLGNRQYYVRIPWQLYLIEGAAICRPLRILLTSDIRSALLDAIQAINTSEGYIYQAFGHMKSTRTYSMLMDTLWHVDAQLDSSKYVASLSAVANWVTRVIYARSVSWILLIGAIGLAAAGVRAWLVGNSGHFGAIGAEISAAVLLGFIGFLLRRIRAKGRRSR